MMLGTVARGLLWLFAPAIGVLTVKYGLPALGESEAAEVAKWIVASVFVLVAMFWSKKKDNTNKAMDPPV